MWTRYITDCGLGCFTCRRCHAGAAAAHCRHSVAQRRQQQIPSSRTTAALRSPSTALQQHPIPHPAPPPAGHLAIHKLDMSGRGEKRLLLIDPLPLAHSLLPPSNLLPSSFYPISPAPIVFWGGRVTHGDIPHLSPMQLQLTPKPRTNRETNIPGSSQAPPCTAARCRCQPPPARERPQPAGPQQIWRRRGRWPPPGPRLREGGRQGGCNQSLAGAAGSSGCTTLDSIAGLHLPVAFTASMCCARRAIAPAEGWKRGWLCAAVTHPPGPARRAGPWASSRGKRPSGCTAAGAERQGRLVAGLPAELLCRQRARRAAAAATAAPGLLYLKMSAGLTGRRKISTSTWPSPGAGLGTSATVSPAVGLATSARSSCTAFIMGISWGCAL